MADWVIVVDDDENNLKMVGRILSKAHMRVTAMKSGRALLDYIRGRDDVPDLILLDIKMPKMDGFETLRRLKEQEKDKEEVPVVFLTSDDETESEKNGFAMGVSDYIKKPFEPGILIQRIQNVIQHHREVLKLQGEVIMDKMTGFLNKEATNNRLSETCREKTGCLCAIDLDSFKQVNDLFGHDMGDQVIILFADLLRQLAPSDSIFGRIGGDEFLVFFDGILTEQDLANITENLNHEFVSRMHVLKEESVMVSLGVSLGAVFVPKNGTEYTELFGMADKALLHVKQNGKHGYSVFETKKLNKDEAMPDLKTLSKSLSERNVSHFAMWMGQESFGDVYRYMMRYIERYHGRAFKLLFSAKPNADFSGRITDLSGEMQNIIQHCLRSSDFMMQTGELQFFLFLPEVDETGIEHVINRIMGAWDDSGFSKKASLTYESENVRSQVLRSPNAGEADHIVVVDDDVTNLKFAKIILSKADMRVTALKSGKALLDFLKLNRPDLILLDVKMPEMDGFDTLRKMRRTDNGDVPVIFLTADENYETETKCLTTGAVDFIKKPFVPEVLKIRVRHNVELNRLQKHLEKEVTYKTEEVEKLSINIVKALAEAIDAKDAYTNGHSSRVAEYSREIARRYGYSEKSLEEIYMMGLLHDVGKIGVPDAVINKPAKLTDEEYNIIKNHPVLGARILGKIKEMPSLQMGARWHHERFDGHGYPDGLAGENIPEEARIIAVADAYDAMTSHRSYREPLPQGIVRGEIEKGMGTQFDPHFAKIMLEIMDEDTEYKMREE